MFSIGREKVVTLLKEVEEKQIYVDRHPESAKEFVDYLEFLEHVTERVSYGIFDNLKLNLIISWSFFYFFIFAILNSLLLLSSEMCTPSFFLSSTGRGNGSSPRFL